MPHSAPVADAKTVPIAVGIVQPYYPLCTLEPYAPTSVVAFSEICASLIVPGI